MLLQVGTRCIQRPRQISAPAGAVAARPIGGPCAKGSAPSGEQAACGEGSAKLLKRPWADAVQLPEVRLADVGELFKACVPGGCEGSLRWLGQLSRKVPVTVVAMLSLHWRCLPVGSYG
jgi:hypothetical protein